MQWFKEKPDSRLDEGSVGLVEEEVRSGDSGTEFSMGAEVEGKA